MANAHIVCPSKTSCHEIQGFFFLFALNFAHNLLLHCFKCVLFMTIHLQRHSVRAWIRCNDMHKQEIVAQKKFGLLLVASLKTLKCSFNCCASLGIRIVIIAIVIFIRTTFVMSNSFSSFDSTIVYDFFGTTYRLVISTTNQRNNCRLSATIRLLACKCHFVLCSVTYCPFVMLIISLNSQNRLQRPP